MPRFLNTLGNSNLGIGICDRCKFKFALVELRPDGNNPGLMVCGNAGCYDELDPYRLPALQDDRLILPFVRPDEPLTVPQVSGDQGPFRITQDDEYRTTDDDDFRTVEDDN